MHKSSEAVSVFISHGKVWWYVSGCRCPHGPSYPGEGKGTRLNVDLRKEKQLGMMLITPPSNVQTGEGKKWALKLYPCPAQ